MKMYPIISGKISIVEHKKNIIGYNRDTKKYFVINKNSLDLLKLVDGKTNLEKIIEKISFKKKASKELLFEDITTILEKMKLSGLIIYSNTPKHNPIRHIKYDFKYPLRRAFIEVTNKCNLKCKHCYNDSSSQCSDNLDKEILFSFIDEIDKMGVFQVNLTGGEPFIRKDFKEIITYLYNKGIDYKILTNGLLLDTSWINYLKKMNPKEIAISLDAITEEKYKEIRGVSNKKVIENIVLLKKQNIRVKINVVLFKGINDTYEEMYKIFSFLKKKKFKHTDITIDEFVVAGRGLNNTNYKIIEASKTIENIKRACKKVYGEDYFFNPELTENRLIDNQEKIPSYCGLGESILYLNPKGLVIPCPMLNFKELVLGDILKEDVKNIWEKEQKFTKFFRNKEHIKNSVCETCSKLSICAGGCKAKMYLLKNKFNLPNVYACTYFGK